MVARRVELKPSLTEDALDMKSQDDDFCAAPVWMSEDKHQIQASSASDWELDVHAAEHILSDGSCV